MEPHSKAVVSTDSVRKYNTESGHCQLHYTRILQILDKKLSYPNDKTVKMNRYYGEEININYLLLMISTTVDQRRQESLLERTALTLFIISLKS